MDLKYTPGQTLIIELNDECYKGELRFISKDRTRIELINVSDCQTNDAIEGIQTFYKSDIKSIKCLKNDSGVSSPTTTLSDVHDEFDKYVEESSKKFISLTTGDMEDTVNIVKNCKHIYQTDRVYHEAINNLRKQTTIVVNLESCNMGRHSYTSILTIFGGNVVYVFDILSLGQIFPELKIILESEKPHKIVYDGRKITDNLKHAQNVELRIYFDCLFAHIALGGDKTVIALDECIKHYFDLPEAYFENKKDINWNKRPFDDMRISVTAKHIIFLQKLYEYFLYERILCGFSSNCRTFANVFANNTDTAQVVYDMAINNNSAIDDISEIELDLSLDVENLRI